MFYFLFCFKKKHLSKKENFLSENTKTWHRWHELKRGPFLRWKCPLSPGAQGLWPWSWILHGPKSHPPARWQKGTPIAPQMDVGLPGLQLSAPMVLMEFPC